MPNDSHVGISDSRLVPAVARAGRYHDGVAARGTRWLLAVIACWFALAACSSRGAGSTVDTLSARAESANAREQRALPNPSSSAGARGRERGRSQAEGARTPLDGYGANVGFRSRQRLTEHFEKHGAEFGNITIDEYLRRAQELRDARAGGDVLEIVRGDGVVSRFDRASGAFLAFDRDGTIRTFFRPNDGERYFKRQSRRTPIP